MHACTSVVAYAAVVSLLFGASGRVGFAVVAFISLVASLIVLRYVCNGLVALPICVICKLFSVRVAIPGQLLYFFLLSLRKHAYSNI